MVTLKLVTREEGRIATITKATKHHRCSVCQEYIIKGTQYYTVTIAGSGLGSIKFPEHVHIECLSAYFEKVRRSREL